MSVILDCAERGWRSASTHVGDLHVLHLYLVAACWQIEQSADAITAVDGVEQRLMS